MNLPHIVECICVTIGAAVVLGFLISTGVIFVSLIDGILCRPAELDAATLALKEYASKIQILELELAEQNRRLALYYSKVSSTATFNPNTQMTLTHTEGNSEKY